MVARGGASTPLERWPPKFPCTPEAVPEPNQQFIPHPSFNPVQPGIIHPITIPRSGTPPGVRSFLGHRSGGLRCAATSGYRLTPPPGVWSDLASRTWKVHRW